MRLSVIRAVDSIRGKGMWERVCPKGFI